MKNHSSPPASSPNKKNKMPQRHRIRLKQALSLPNQITFIRILLVPALVYWLVQGQYRMALYGFLLGALTDGLDGWLARVLHSQTPLGAYLDPLADKCLLISLYGTFALLKQLPLWLVIPVIGRDILILLGVFLVKQLGTPPRMKPTLISKINTGLEITLVLLVLLKLIGKNIAPGLELFFCYIVLLTTCFSGYSYLKIGAKLLKKKNAS